MFKSFTGYTSCKDTFKDAIQISIIGITNHFVSVVFNPKVANRYKLKMQSATYYWMDEHSGAVVKAHIQLEGTRDRNILFIDVEDTPGLPCMFAIRFNPYERFPLESYEIFHKGASPSNAIVQGIYGRLVDHTDALDYKDLDYV